MKSLVTFSIVIYLFFTVTVCAEERNNALLAKFEPPSNKVLVFIGQDNEAIGGTQKWKDGYIDNVGIPAGITHYVYFTEGKTNNFGYTFDKGTIDGLAKETSWGAGPMCMACYFQSKKLENMIVHLSISMEFGSEDDIAQGKYDHLIKELTLFLQHHQKTPFLIRIGYEFEGEWNDYDAPNFKLAWRRIVDALNNANLNNYATVFASSRWQIPMKTWLDYWPGDDYVDWIGYSYWANDIAPKVALELARIKNKPVFIAEATPRGFWLAKNDGNMIWRDWFKILFDHIEENSDVIKAVSYINTNWDAQDMWTGWGDTRIENNEQLKIKWLEQMSKDNYVHGTKNTYKLIGFKGR